MIKRNIESVLKTVADQYPVVTITGPRHSGKTTLCRHVFPQKKYVNLESLDTRQFATEDPRGFLARYPDGAILDEIQRAPDLLSYIQAIVDERQIPGMFILTGSQQFEVLNTINQSLSGRTALLKLLPLSISELKQHAASEGDGDIFNAPTYLDRLLLTGFYPRIYDRNLNPTRAMGDYFETYVERDIRQLTAIKDLALFEKFVMLCAGRIGQILNLQSLANDVGISHTTARTWLTLLEASYIIFILRPWFRNFSKRLVKSPKLYFYDVGLASFLLGLESELHVSRDPLKGNLFENLAVIEALKFRFNQGKRGNLHFYRDSKGNEVDLLIEVGPDIFPVEIKMGATVIPDYFRGIRNFTKSVTELPWGSGLIYGGDEVQIRSDVRVYPVWKIDEMLESLEGGAE